MKTRGGPKPGRSVPCPRISGKETRSLILDTVEKARLSAPHSTSLEARGWTSGRGSVVRRLPAWVGRFGLMAGPHQYGLWCEPLPAPGDTFPSQMSLDVPPGRYMVEILDAATLNWVSRESAEGALLVAGLPYTGNPVLAWIRNIGHLSREASF